MINIGHNMLSKDVRFTKMEIFAIKGLFTILITYNYTVETVTVLFFLATAATLSPNDNANPCPLLLILT